GQESISVRQHVRMVHGLVNSEPEDFVHFGRIGRDDSRFEFGEPAPQHPWWLAEVVPPDTAYGYHLGTEFLAHFPHYRVSLAFAPVDPAARKADSQGHAHRGTAADQEPAPVRVPTGHHDTFQARFLLWGLYHLRWPFSKKAIVYLCGSFKGTSATTTACS